MLNRRDFIKLCAKGLVTLSLSQTIIPELAEALAAQPGKPALIWLETTTCTGNLLSFLNTLHPKVQQVLFNTVEFVFANTLSAGEGSRLISYLENTAWERRGEYILVVEGTIATRDKGRWCVIGHREDGSAWTALEAVRYLARYAKYIVAAGTCASFGGPFAAHPNPSGSRPLHKVVPGQVINVPGCPVHPDWAVGTLSHLLLYGVPELDAYNRPKLFYGLNIHDHCPRRNDFNNSNFAQYPGDGGCLYKIGCKGPVTFSDCPTRKWIGEHHNWPVGANSPCIGCVSPEFPDGMSPFFEHLLELKTPAIMPKLKTLGALAGGATLGGIGAHLAANVLTGRLGDHLVGGTETAHLNPQPDSVDQGEEVEALSKQISEIIAQQEIVKQRIKNLKSAEYRRGILQKLTSVFKGKIKQQGKGEH